MLKAIVGLIRLIDGKSQLVLKFLILGHLLTSSTNIDHFAWAKDILYVYLVLEKGRYEIIMDRFKRCNIIFWTWSHQSLKN